MDAFHNVNGFVTCGDAVTRYRNRIRHVLKGHLNWVFRYAQRPQGYWHRSYLTTGRPKDGPVFQLDQQCYPLLELADFFDLFPEDSEFVRGMLNDKAVGQVLTQISSRREQSTGLVATEETPGDDPVEFDYHLSSHILLWYTLVRIGVLLKRVGASDPELASEVDQLAASLKSATLRHFVKLGPKTGQHIFVYLTDGKGQHRTYHDANDIPTLFAKDWGLLETDEQRSAWQNTMNFAFSEDNEGGYDGKGLYGGLGSVHSPGPWVLGYFQQWRWAQMAGDRPQEENAWAKICGTMQLDGTFCEAVGYSGECTSKAWFSWPGAMIGSGLLHQDNRERYLG